MSKTVLVIGESGTGKSTAIHTLDPNSTFIFSVLGKPLPFRGYKNKYNADQKNYHVSDDYKIALSYIKAINERRPEITTLVIDDFVYLMSHEFMGRVMEKGYDKYNELASHIWMIFKALTNCRDDLTCFVLSHSDIDNQGKSKVRTIGKMLDDKVCLEGMVSTVLHSMIVDGEYKFLTQNNSTHLAKSPMGMFDDLLIDNDLQYVKEKIESYFNEGEE